MEETLSQSDTLALPITQDYAAQQRELRRASTFDWFGDKILPGLLQAAAIITVVAIGLFSSGLGTALASIGMLAFELARAQLHNEADLNRELVLYHKEIAEVLGKSSAEPLTVKDMYAAVDEKIVGDKAIKPLQIELEHLAYRGRYNLVMGAIRAVVAAGAAIALHGMMSGARAAIGGETGVIDVKTLLASHQLGSLFMPLTATLGVVGGATLGIERMGKNYFDRTEPLSVYHELTELQDQNKEQALKPEQAFNVVIKLDKELAQEIHARLGKPYAELSYRNKMRVMQACESRAHAHALTEAINNDALPVTAIAMSACQQLDWTGGSIPTMLSKGHARVPELPEQGISNKSFVANLISQRNAKAQAPEHRIS